jgi:hypothetical protein
LRLRQAAVRSEPALPRRNHRCAILCLTQCAGMGGTAAAQIMIENGVAKVVTPQDPASES